MLACTKWSTKELLFADVLLWRQFVIVFQFSIKIIIEIIFVYCKFQDSASYTSHRCNLFTYFNLSAK